jgi:translation initiation factor 1
VYPELVPRKRPPNTVFSTQTGKVCISCGWPVKRCQCSRGFDEAVPDRIVARLRIEKAGRRGKTVTVVEGLPRNTDFLKGLAKELKRACGTGGTVVENRVELQGDHREKLRAVLAAKGWTVKG